MQLPILGIIPKHIKDRAGLVESTEMYKDEILDTIGIEHNEGIFSQIKERLSHFLGRSK